MRLRHKPKPKQDGPFWGLLAQRKPIPLFLDFVSNAMVVAPAGSGKGICSVIPNILSIQDSKAIGDMKGELICVLKAALEKRGETVRFLNPSDLWRDQLGSGDQYSPVDIIVDSLFSPGCLRDVPDDLREMAMQIYPEPEEQGENAYFREGSRDCIQMGIILEAMVEGYDATFSSVALLSEDREALEYNLRWITGVDINGAPMADGPLPIEQTEWAQRHDPQDVAEFAKLIRARATNLLKLLTAPDSRTFASFIKGAPQALAPFAFGRLAPAMGRSTFSMNDLKGAEGPVSLFVVSDASRPEVYKAFSGLIQWCALTAMKRHPDKARPVYFIMDEATNYKINGLDSLLTWGRSYGIRLMLIFQDMSAFERVYGKQAVETLLSETEIKLFLPGQRSPKTLELIETMLGKVGMMMAGLSGQSPEQGLHEHLSESARPLMYADEIRRSRSGLLFVRDLPPFEVEPISYAEVEPWRSQADINPFHGKPFLKKVKLRLRGWRKHR